MAINPQNATQATWSVDFGADVSTFLNGDLDPSFASITGQYAVAEACVRRLGTPRGSLVDDADFGYDLRLVLNRGLQPGEVYTIAENVRAECLKDERVLDSNAEP
jgi:hypothetical protein